MKKENINEADKVFNKYYNIWINSDMSIRKNDFYKIVIQDRQSVLDELKVIKNHLGDNTDSYLNSKITNLTEQIEYLKSKL